ncbi:hypothetical protein [Fibrivirga algicola]|uniref:Cardiolipin synthase N-terminal domain-containing protein n=1 Tax=Fibrivirga algicola TaxID=2950420 RepID=A0ABX0QGT3_9BACT|nr:hypothetical protein [Fibrivirga algicola]ARK10088.1 hypothetical protein A6C57_06900 [Fibrella sp. ES10-3-2-2]NID11449.1 hypothetical protein [Fibrivirga algicola]
MVAFIGIGGQEVLFLLIFVLLIPLIPLWTIFKKSGQSPWWSLLAFIPGVGILLALYVAAFSTWRVGPED